MPHTSPHGSLFTGLYALSTESFPSNQLDNRICKKSSLWCENNEETDVFFNIRLSQQRFCDVDLRKSIALGKRNHLVKSIASFDTSVVEYFINCSSFEAEMTKFNFIYTQFSASNVGNQF